MRILVVNWNPTAVGGAEQYLRSVMPALAGAGHELAFVHGYAADRNETTISEAARRSWCFKEIEFAQLLRAIGEWGPELVWIHMNDSPALERALCARYPVLFFAHTYDFTCPTGMKLQCKPVAHPCSRRAGAACLALYYPRRCGGLNPLTMIRGYQRQQLRLKTAKSSQGFVVASRYMKQELEAHGISADKVHIAPLFSPDMQADREPPSPRPLTGDLLFVGRLVMVKGVEYAIAACEIAAKRSPLPLRLTIAGEGGDRVKLSARAGKASLPVRLTGWLGVEERLRLMRSSDLLVFPSVWPEPFGLVGIEAGCVGLPAAGYAVGGAQEWLRPGDSGEVAAGQTPTVEGLADAICRALGDEQAHHRLRQGAWRVATEHTLSRHMELLEEIFDQHRQIVQ